MGPVQQAIRANLSSNTQLLTRSRPSPFLLSEITGEGIVLLLAMKHRTPISWGCLEGVMPVLRGKEWVVCGGRHSVNGEPGTLDEYLKRHGPPRDVTNWVAAVLEKAGVAELDLGPPLSIRLAPKYR